MNILLVDGDLISLKDTARLLRLTGHNVVECADGQEALFKFFSEDFSLVLTELNLAKITGLELLKAIKSLESAQYTEVVFCSSEVEPPVIINAFKAGAYDYLIKPVNMARLLALTGEIASLRTKDSAEKFKAIIHEKMPVIRRGLAAALAEESSLKVVAETDSQEQCLEAIKRHEPRLVIIGMEEDLLAFELCRGIKKKYPDVKVVMLAAEENLSLAARSLREGASAFVSKGAELSEILFVLKRVCQGSEFVAVGIAEKILNELYPVAEGYLEKLNFLTKQEEKVLRYLAGGLTNKEIADEMYLSTATIRNYVSNILKKLNLPNRAAAMAFAIKCFNENNWE